MSELEKIQSNDDLKKRDFFHPSGLCFQCRRCSGCCRFSPGFVFLSHEDLAGLLEATGATFHEFFSVYLRIVPIGFFSRLSLREKANYDCIFWENDGCRVYEHRPLQCRSYPFWSSILSSRESWEEQKRSCPGIDGGALHAPDEIDRWLSLRLKERLIEVESAEPSALEKAHLRFLEDRRGEA
ncbi:MAG: YkgJ family cysteine cluster protein [Spirochaetales bacterium]|nr:YkgJ family cysteine cluster protein [Spirochaetales bacterium]